MLFKKAAMVVGSSIMDAVKNAKNALFTSKMTPGKSVPDGVDLVFLIDSTGGMANNDALEQVIVCTPSEGVRMWVPFS